MPRPRVNPKRAMTDAERAARSRANREADGGRQIAVNLTADAAASLDRLVESEWAAGPTDAVNKSLISEAKRRRLK